MCKVSPAMAAGRGVKNRNSKTNQKRVIRIFQRLMYTMLCYTMLCFMLQDILQNSFFFKTLKPQGWLNLDHATSSSSLLFECLVAFIHFQWSDNFLVDTNTCGYRNGDFENTWKVKIGSLLQRKPWQESGTTKHFQNVPLLNKTLLFGLAYQFNAQYSCDDYGSFKMNV